VSTTELTERIDALLPQTQCTQCGYKGCLPYAEAIAAGSAGINRCPPGGEEVIADLAQLLGRAATALDPACGVTRPPAVALIDEAWCIGCTLCIQACPVDAIVGAAKLMHTVIVGQCTGCELCIPPCPVDCIAMTPVTRETTRSAQLARAAQARTRYEARNARLARSTPRARKSSVSRSSTDDANATSKHAAIARAMERARARIKNTV
jgi:electron transport complex protein RnfB